MLGSVWRGVSAGRVNPVVPALVVVAGATIAVAGNPAVGTGIAIGALLAYVNGLLLSRRVDVAATTGDVGQAMLVMQVGLLVSFTVIGVATVILVKISEALAVATVGGFVVAHVAILAAYFWTHARGQVIERKAL